MNSAARVLNKWWVKLLISAVMTVAEIGICIGMLYLYDKNDDSADVFWGLIMIAALGNFALYAAVNLNLPNNFITKLFRFVLKIGGLALIIVPTLLSILMYADKTTLQTDMPDVFIPTEPMQQTDISTDGTADIGLARCGLFGMMMIGETVYILLLYWNARIKYEDIASERRLNFAEFVLGFAVPMSVVSLFLGFVLSICFAVIAKAVHPFFYCWFAVLLCVAAYVFSLIIFIRRVKKRKKLASVGSSVSGRVRTEIDNAYTEDKAMDKKELEKALADALHAHNSKKFLPDENCLLNVNGLWWDDLFIYNRNNFMNREKIVLNGTIRCDIRREEDDIDGVIERIKDHVELEIMRAVEEVGGDGFDVDCNYIKVKYRIV